MTLIQLHGRPAPRKGKTKQDSRSEWQDVGGVAEDCILRAGAG